MRARRLPSPRGCDWNCVWGSVCAATVPGPGGVQYFGPLAVQASSHPGGDIRGQSFPYVTGGNEATGCLHAWVGGPEQVVEYLPAEVQIANLGWSGVSVPVGIGFGGGPCL
jgi:hypothetical protein